MSLLKLVNGQPKLKLKLAMFDLDDTLIKYNHSDTPYLLPNVVDKLATLSDYTVLVLSNQLDVADTEDSKKTFKTKLAKMFDQIKIPMIVYCSKERDFNRKPGTGMIETFLKEYEYQRINCGNNYTEIVKEIYGIDLAVHNEDKWFLDHFDHKNSFYVGDAAGRRNDHSDCDLKLAVNMGIAFYTPEMFFANKTIDYKLNYINIRKYVKGGIKTNEKDIEMQELDNLDMYKYIFIYGKGYSAQDIFFGVELNKQQEVIYNCNDIYTIEKYGKNHDAICLHLDYDKNVLRWMKIFSQLTDKDKNHCILDFNKLKSNNDFGKIVDIPFVFDDKKFDNYEKKVSRLLL